MGAVQFSAVTVNDHGFSVPKTMVISDGQSTRTYNQGDNIPNGGDAKNPINYMKMMSNQYYRVEGKLLNPVVSIDCPTAVDDSCWYVPFDLPMHKIRLYIYIGGMTPQKLMALAPPNPPNDWEPDVPSQFSAKVSPCPVGSGIICNGGSSWVWAVLFWCSVGVGIHMYRKHKAKQAQPTAIKQIL